MLTALLTARARTLVPGDRLMPELEPGDLLERGDYVRAETGNPAIPFYGVIRSIVGDSVLVTGKHGTRAWADIGDVTLLIKKAALTEAEAAINAV